jgi:hypothetical protein
MEATPHRLFGRKTLGAGFVEVVAALGTGESITYVAHDTARVSAGGGSHSGRSMKLAATIIGHAEDASTSARNVGK